MRYNNYHVHTHYSNPQTIDTIMKPIDLINRAKELGHTTLSTCEHGYAGNFIEKFDSAKNNGLKLLYGMEIYYVNDRFEKDNLNSHLCVFAKSRKGFEQINSCMSEANRTGYYYKARWDKELLLSLDPNEVMITTACVGSYIGKSGDPDYEKNFIIPLHNHFKHNFFLEIQDNLEQKEYNSLILQLHNKYGIETIHGCDSHYLFPEDAKKRDLFLKGKGIIYEDESTFILDYPDSDTIFRRYEEQGVFTKEQAEKALKNTLIMDDFEDIIFTKDIKMPTIYPNQDSNKVLQKILAEKWKEERQHIPIEKHEEYKQAIRDEFNIIKKTGMVDYFLINEKVIAKGKEKGGVLTRTGRGSAPSFYNNKLLGFTEIDRLDSEIPLYPTRFMSVSRILETKSLPDIDFNCADTTPFVEACKEILGQDNVYFMVAFGTMKEKAAFRNYCRAIDLEIKDYNDIDVESMKEDSYWGKIIKESEMFLDVIDNIKPSPCSYLLLDKPISKEIGLIKIKDEMCCVVDGYWADNYKFLKNDFLTVSVWEIIADTFKLINKPIPNIRELKQLLDDKVWKLYEDGITATLNQADTDHATTLIKKYKPKSIAEISGFVAAIRPGFASMLEIFLNRESFSYGIPEFDELLKSSQNFCLYQENVMQTLMFAGIPEDETYGILKLIAKKRGGVDKVKDRFLTGFIKRTNSPENAQKVWEIIEANVDYSFNSSHSLSVSLDSLYGAYLKANYPLEYYTVILNKHADEIEKTEKIVSELPYFNINLQPIKFRKSQGKYSFSKDDNSIYKGVASLKNLNSQVAEELYLLKDNEYSSFPELLIDIKEKTSCNSKQLDILIKLNFFSEFGLNQKLLDFVQLFSELYDSKQMKKDKVDKLKLSHEVVEQYSRQTEKTYMDFRSTEFLQYMWTQLEDKSISILDQINAEREYLGYIQTTYPNMDSAYCLVTEVNTKYTPKVTTYSLANGTEQTFKVYKKIFSKNPLKEGDVIRVAETQEKPKPVKLEDGNWGEHPSEREIIMTKYSKIANKT